MHLHRRAWLLAAMSVFAGCRHDGRRESAAGLELSIRTDRRYQTFEGFGTSLIGWVPAMDRFYRTDEFRRLYLEGLGASALRIDLWGPSVPARDQWRDLSFRDFLLTGDGARAKVLVDAAETLVRASGGKLRVLASIWTPPPWMKENGQKGHGGPRQEKFGLSPEELTQVGRPEPAKLADEHRMQRLHRNRLRADRYVHFAKSLVEWCRLLAARGIELYGLSLQNEPRFSHWFESCTYTPAELARLARVVVETFQEEGQRLPPLFLPETMSHDVAGNSLYLRELFADEKVRAHVGAIATHGYIDGYAADRDPRSVEKLRELARPFGKPIWVTEGGSGTHEWPGPLHDLATGLAQAFLQGDVSLIAPWQVVGSEPSQHDLAALSGPTKKTFVASQFFRHLRPGMQRVQVEAQTSADTDCVAFHSGPGAACVLILVHRGRFERALRLRVGDRAARIREAFVTDATRNHQRLQVGGASTLTLPPESVATILLA